VCQWILIQILYAVLDYFFGGSRYKKASKSLYFVPVLLHLVRVTFRVSYQNML